jgi:hypothetical protein
VGEISRFLADNLKEYFLAQQSEFSPDEAVEKNQAERFRARLEELVVKATKRLGHEIDRVKLVDDACHRVLELKNLGEIPESNLLEKFCTEIEKPFKPAA